VCNLLLYIHLRDLIQWTQCRAIKCKISQTLTLMICLRNFCSVAKWKLYFWSSWCSTNIKWSIKAIKTCPCFCRNETLDITLRIPRCLYQIWDILYQRKCHSRMSLGYLRPTTMSVQLYMVLCGDQQRPSNRNDSFSYHTIRMHAMPEVEHEAL